LSDVTFTTARTDGVARTASRTLTVPMTFVSYVPRGSAKERRTKACAAMWMTISGSWSANARRSASWSRMSARTSAMPSPTPASS
jgi:hypothetical protein